MVQCSSGVGGDSRHGAQDQPQLTGAEGSEPGSEGSSAPGGGPKMDPRQQQAAEVVLPLLQEALRPLVEGQVGNWEGGRLAPTAVSQTADLVWCQPVRLCVTAPVLTCSVATPVLGLLFCNSNLLLSRAWLYRNLAARRRPHWSNSSSSTRRPTSSRPSSSSSC